MSQVITASELRHYSELQDVEWKESLAKQKKGFESLCGMLNSDANRGVVFFGVNPKGECVGIEPGNLDSAQKKLALRAHAFDPPLHINIDVFECEGKKLIKVSANRDPKVPFYEYDGRAHIREGTITRRLSISEREGLIRRRNRDSHPGPWKCDKCGTLIGKWESIQLTPDGVRKSYKHSCGGEVWPVS